MSDSMPLNHHSVLQWLITPRFLMRKSLISLSHSECVGVRLEIRWDGDVEFERFLESVVERLKSLRYAGRVRVIIDVGVEDGGGG